MSRALGIVLILVASASSFLLGRLTGRLEIFSVAEWGTVADWVGGVGTAAAVVFASYQLASDRRREELNEMRVRKSSASAVAVVDLLVDSRGILRGFVSNGGPLPIFQCLVCVSLDGDRVKMRVGTVATGGKGLFSYDGRTLAPTIRPRDVSVRFLDSYGTVWESSDTHTRVVRELGEP